MEPTRDNNPFAIPPDVLAVLQAEAEAEHRPAVDVLQDAVQRYVRESRWQRLMAKGQARAKAHGFTEEDVPRLIAEFREEQRQGR